MRTDNSIKNSITSFIYNIITILLLFIEQTIFIKILGVEYSGLNGLFTNILTLLNLIELGFGSAITFNLYKYVKKNDKETIKSIMDFFRKAYNIISIIILIVGLIILIFLKYLIKEVTIDINIYFIYLLFLISTISTYILSYKRNLIYANQKNYILNIFHICYIFILSILQILVLYLTKNYYLFIIVKIVCILIENILISIKANKLYPYLKDKNIKSLKPSIKDNIIKRVKALFIHKTSAAVTNGTDNILISTFLGLKVVGLYTNYFYIINAITKLFSIVITSTAPSVGNLLVDNNYEKNYEIFNKIRFLNYWITVFTSVCLLLLIEPFITIWLGKEYLLSKLVLFTLILNYYQSMMRSTYSVFKEGAGIWIEDRFVPLIQLTINITTSIILLKIFGLSGIFMGTILSSLSLWFYSYPKYVYKKLFNKNTIDYIKEIFNHILLFMLIIIISYLLNLYFKNIIISIIISIFIPNIILLIIYRTNDNFKYYIELIKKYINNIKHCKRKNIMLK